MKQHKGLKAACAAVASLAMLAALPGMANAADGKGVDALSVHGGAQRIATIGSKSAKNVILFIGDGMGDSEITVARNYLHGVNGSFDGIDKIGQPSALGDTEVGTGQYTTFSLGANSNDSLVAKDKTGKLAGSKTAGVITPVTDSSASGSSWATGTKTYNNAVDIDVKGNPQLNLIELAKAAGKATGNVTTAEIQDATPAVLESHSSERACYGPQGKWDGKTDTNGDGKIDPATDGNQAKNCLADQLKVNGGIGSISEQLLDTRADVTIGGGSKYFNQFDQNGNTLWQQAKDRGFQTVQSGDVNGFKNLKSADQNSPVLALLGDGNLPTKFNPSVATKADPAKDENPTTCTVNDKWLGNQGASLADFTNKALDLLQGNPNGKSNGFFLQVEGASIDKQDHNANACGQIGETDDLDAAVSAALKKVDLKDTLIIVTADHAHTSQIVEAQPYYALSTVLKNKLGEKMVVSYGTSDAPVYQDENGDPIDNDEYTQGENGDANTEEKFDGAQGNMSHTGTQLRIAASGPGASRVDGLTDQTDNFYTIAKALGLATDKADQDALSAKAEVKAQDNKNQVFDATGFNGDAVLSYKLTDDQGKTVAASADTTGLSGVRVQTAGTTTLDLSQYVKQDGKYTLTVTGRQSGKTVTIKNFAGPTGTEGNQSGEVTPGAGENGQNANKPIASGKVEQPAPVAGKLGKTGATVMGVVLAAAALLVAGGLMVAAKKGVFGKR
ncbi:alkaline phosphatase [Bifidobacterium avesanii]|uniref:Alkaline phosphatase n=1 Tax=Bifidobacterium avesanii TaxID=1798157 RepID=A0A7K3TK71_9BIFI|nr:alkaline phosphatase [Bifidobacterium avesanii]KAB8291963.1 alkaline phosphatase [Bifidobacterium avesanii]NEG79064.1 alkaline phosphatase [Bifidobacterium avesanii]